jgi:hypothetical protein
MPLDQVRLGTPPSGQDGDDPRTAFTRINNNFKLLDDAGISGPIAQTREVVNYNDVNQPGEFIGTATALGRPDGFGRAKLRVSLAFDDVITQVAIDHATGRIASRSRPSGSNWYAWNYGLGSAGGALTGPLVSTSTLEAKSLSLTSLTDTLIVGGVTHAPVAIGPVISIAKNENMVAEFISASSTSAWGGRFNFLRSRGTTAEPTPPSIDDTVGGIQFVPYHGSGYGAGAYILGVVDEAAVSGSVVPTRMLFRGKAVYAGTMGAVTQASYCAEFQGSGSVTNGNRLIFSQNSTYAAAMAANSTGGTSGRMTFQWITRADGTLQSTPMEMNFDGSVVFGGVVRPRTDNSFTLGNSALRWSTVYAGTGTINTSDARDKTDVRGLTEAELAAAKDLSREIGAYKFLASVAEKGDDAREHIGMTVQRAVEIMESHGLDPFGYSFICFDEWEDTVIEHPAQYEQVATPALLDEEGREIEPGGFVDGALVSEAYTEVVVPAGNKYSFRMDGLLAFIAAGLEARLTALEAA